MKRKIIIVFYLCLCSFFCFAQKTFRLGVSAGLGLSQIEGDNLKGFREASYEASLLGGFIFNSSNEFILGLGYEHLGSTRGGEDVPRIFGKYLAEINIDQMSLFMGYAKAFNQDWDGRYKFRLKGGLKYNRILSKSSGLIAFSVIDDYNLGDDDFRSNYLSLKLGFGTKLNSNLFLDFNYEHALQSILHDSDEILINNLIPFGIGFTISYYFL